MHYDRPFSVLMDTAIAPSFAAAPVPPRARGRRAAVLLGSVLLVTFLVYAGTLRFGFVYDDAAQIVSNPAMRSWSNLPRLFAQHVWSSQLAALPNYYRPVFMAWCLAQFKLFGSNPLPWHLALVVLHLIATALVFQLARRIFADDFVATIAAAIFGLHPIHLESVAWISGATDPLMAIFCLGSVLCYLRYRESAMPHFGWLLLSLLQYGLACLSKEPAIVLPAIIALHEYLTWNERRVLTKIVHAVIRTAPLLLVSAAYLVQRWVVLRAIGHASAPLPVATLPLSWPALLWFYAHKLVWPARLALFYDVQPVLAPTWQNFWVPLLLVLGIAIGLFIVIRRLPDDRENRAMSPPDVAWFGLAWIVAFILPVLDIVSLEPGAIAHDRYLYLPSVGFALLLALGISRLRLGHAKLFGAPATQVAFVTVVACAMTFGTVKQSVYWANDLLLYYRAVDVSPASLTAVNRLADALLQRDYTSEGIRLHEQILRSNPSFWQSHFQLGNAYFKVGRFGEAEEHLLAASRLQPATPQIYIYLAIAQIRNQHYDAAEQSARAAVALWPNTPGGFYVLGTALAQQGHWPEAVAAFERELANDPDQPKVRAELEAARRHVR